ncbi:hypothetical protein [Paenibacillus sp. QZ-Y1]|uniref:hypothetical protein n=1 Tax=Paenibacillus sp. QZ-Y1 TaxID=3414511 RepID=UPI003F7AD6A1
MIIDIEQLSSEIQSVIKNQTNEKKVDFYWGNFCSDEGEDCHELYIDSEDNQINYIYRTGWGEITSLEEALEELE